MRNKPFIANNNLADAHTSLLSANVSNTTLPYMGTGSRQHQP